jgi:amino acid transporter
MFHPSKGVSSGSYLVRRAAGGISSGLTGREYVAGMRLFELLLGRPLRSDEETLQRIGVLTAIPVLGLDALGSASYGPEAAMTVLLPVGAAATLWVRPITLAIVGVLAVVAISYAQTIPAYPNGGGSFTVAKENLGRTPGLLAAAALCTDYVLNVAVGISAGIGAICSAEPRLLPYTLPLCLGVLALLMIVNLRGVRESGLAFLLPTYLFVASLLLTLGLGVWKTVMAHGHPTPVVPPPHLPATVAAASLWLLLRAFASGCTALTGVEAVSNAVPIFREPRVHRARRTLAALAVILAVLLLGISFVSQAYGITATEPGKPGYQSVISQIVGAVTGRGWFYFVTMGAVFSVLTLSANTSFADFPRVCRLLALDEYLPPAFAHRGRRLVYSRGIISLTVIAGALLIAFGGITDRLIPLFAVGAFLAFTMSQLGMVMHWRRVGGPGARRSLWMNATGAAATTVTLGIIIVSKFTEGAWLTVIVIPLLVLGFRSIRRYYDRLWGELGDSSPLDVSHLARPLVVVPLLRWDRIARKALRFALSLSDDVRAVQVLTEDMMVEDLRGHWPELVERPARAAGLQPPQLVVIPSEYREFFGPFLNYLRALAAIEPERPLAVLVPELVRRRWYQFFLESRATLLKALLLLEGGPQISVIDCPWYLEDDLDERLVTRPRRFTIGRAAPARWASPAPRSSGRAPS